MDESKQKQKQFFFLLNEQLEKIRKEIREMFSNIDDQFDTMEKIAKWGAKNGWTFPPHTTMQECYDMINGKKQSEMDKEFEKHYGISENYEAMKRKLLSNTLYSQWKELIEDCFDNYERGRYKISIPSLFLILEGTVFDIVKDQDWKKAFKQMGNRLDHGSIKRQMFISVKEFIYNAYSYGNFDSATARPSLINRSWVLHGRDDIKEWKKVDALRLFNALYSLSFLKLQKEGETDEQKNCLGD